MGGANPKGRRRRPEKIIIGTHSLGGIWCVFLNTNYSIKRYFYQREAFTSLLHWAMIDFTVWKSRNCRKLPKSLTKHNIRNNYLNLQATPRLHFTDPHWFERALADYKAWRRDKLISRRVLVEDFWDLEIRFMRMIVVGFPVLVLVLGMDYPTIGENI